MSTGSLNMTVINVHNSYTCYSHDNLTMIYVYMYYFLWHAVAWCLGTRDEGSSELERQWYIGSTFAHSTVSFAKLTVSIFFDFIVDIAACIVSG